MPINARRRVRIYNSDIDTTASESETVVKKRLTNSKFRCALYVGETPKSENSENKETPKPKYLLFWETLRNPSSASHRGLLYVSLFQTAIATKHILAGDVFGSGFNAMTALLGCNGALPGPGRAWLKSYCTFGFISGVISSIDLSTRVLKIYPVPYLHPTFYDLATNFDHICHIAVPTVAFAGVFFAWQFIKQTRKELMSHPIYLLQNQMLRWVPVAHTPGFFHPVRMIPNLDPKLVEWEPFSVPKLLAQQIFSNPQNLPSLNLEITNDDLNDENDPPHSCRTSTGWIVTKDGALVHPGALRIDFES